MTATAKGLLAAVLIIPLGVAEPGSQLLDTTSVDDGS
jgi:hypothetical protein